MILSYGLTIPIDSFDTSMTTAYIYAQCFFRAFSAVYIIVHEFQIDRDGNSFSRASESTRNGALMRINFHSHLKRSNHQAEL